MLWNEQGWTNNYINSYEEISIPAGLSHRLKPARCAAQTVEKVTAGRSLTGKLNKWHVTSLCVLVLSWNVIDDRK